ncbi:MAG: hypothetical protein LQ337_005001 [Flavoplaca oasis]|nr:MAG: hypothetical protein LQ337_005001 [Flavoplaca oasis]
MRSTIISAAFVAGAVATHSNETAPEYTTKVVTAFTTFCPEPTSFSHDGSMITVTSATTVVLPCPSSCIVTYPVTSVPVVYCPTCPSTSNNAPVVPETHPAPVENPAPVETHPAPVVPEAPAAPIETHVTPSGISGPVSPPVSPPTFANSTVPAGPTNPVGTAAPTGAPGSGSGPTPFEGAAPKMAASGASLVGLLGLAAFFL